MCHFQVSSHCWWVPFCHRVLSPDTAGGFHFVIGCCMASHCCCQARNLPWAPVPPPHAAARPVICHGPLYRLLMLLPRS
ncbi:unnamed protein product, partial [Staurois parvus]